MPLKILNGSSRIIINHVDFNQSTNDFLCHDDKEEEPIFRYDLPFAIDALPSDEFTEKIYLFKNEFVTNNTLLKVKLKEKPEQNKLVGYIFPINALWDNPSIFSNKYLKSIAFNVIQKLLNEQDLSLEANSPAYRTDNEYKLSDFYDEDLIVIAICDQFVMFQNYDFMDYLPALYRLGFRLAPNYNFVFNPSDCDVISNNYTQIQSVVTISIPKNKLHKNYFINSLLKNELFLKDNEVARFHLYYQVIEMMIEKVYKNEFKNELVSKFNTLAAFDIKEYAREMLKETFSLDKLTGSNYSNISHIIIEELHCAIETLLLYIGISYKEAAISRKIYKVRNVLFHGYGKVLENPHYDKQKINNLLKKVNDSIEYFLIEIVTSYKDHIPYS